MKRLVVISDLHCGHRVGLTPPGWWNDGKYATGINAKVAKIQRELWKFYATSIDALGPIYGLIVNGDAIDGKGKRSGSSELVAASMNEQCRMAAYAIDYAKAKKVGLIYGTPYHTGTEDDFEYMIGEMCESDIAFRSGQEFPIINGVQFDFKHKVGSSSIPHGRMTALAKANMWNKIWHAERKLQPNARFIIRSHVHYHAHCGGIGWDAMTTPALQGFGSNYGVRQCEGKVDVGMMVFDIEENGDVAWNVIEARLQHQKALPLEF